MNAITQYSGALMPQMTINEALDRYNTMKAFIASVMREGTDFDTIPGTNKPTLHKPGAEKLCSLFGLTVRFVITEKTEDWTGKDHNGEAFFYYAYRCLLWRGDALVAESDGSCNSWEKKYRWRNLDRICPNCNEAAIIKGKKEYGGGWLCWKNKGGCGAKYQENDPAITEQVTGKIPNPDIADLVNTVQKMAQKRAFVGTTLIACNASEYFTQDLEDGGIIEIDPRYVREVATIPAPEPTPDTPAVMTADQYTAINTAGKQLYGGEWAGVARDLVRQFTSGRTVKPSEMTYEEAAALYAQLQKEQVPTPA